MLSPALSGSAVSVCREPSAADPVRAALERHGKALAAELARLGRCGADLRPQTFRCVMDGNAVSVTLAAVWLERLTKCERAILSVLAGAETRLPTGRVLGALEVAGYFFGEATVKRALARLHRLGRIGSSRKSPFGYWHPDRFPEWPIR